jgi:hypothetical protein
MKFIAFLPVSLLFLTACGREEATTYQVPKEPAAPAQSPMMGSASDMDAVAAAHAAMAAHEPAGPGYTAELPEGWGEVPGAGMRKASYTIEGTSIDFYLISLSMGDLSSNVNRWRGQVELPPASAEEIEQAAQTLEIEGHPTRYIEIYNDQGGKGIIAAIVPIEPQFWYFTAKGSVDELKAHAGAIRTFLESIKIDH